MPDYNAHGRKNIRKLLSEISQQIDDLHVTDPRLENLRAMVYELSIRTEELEARLRNLERHEDAGFTLLKFLIFAGFVCIVILVAIYI